MDEVDALSKPFARSTWAVLVALTLAVGAAVVAPAVSAQEAALAPPWDGNPISPGLGPTYGEEWCAQAEPGTSIANQQGDPLALIPTEAIECTLEKIEAEGVAAGLPDRMDYSVIGQSAGGRDLYGVVVNALETPEQRRDYERWQEIRALEPNRPSRARKLLASYGEDVKMPIFVQANIHGNEEEGTDAMMQVLRDLVTLPRGTNEVVDDVLDHSILVVLPIDNPDGRFAGTRANGNGFDMNRDFMVQSQSEVQASVELQQEWLAPVGLDLHGYVSPTLIDGLTKPHNPGIEYDTFLGWNQRRLDANDAALLDVGILTQHPVNHWNPSGLPVPYAGHPYIAEGWDDWGPFYTQTYMAFYGVDSSTVEMCSSQAAGDCNGRFGSWRSQYLTFYSSAVYWLDNRRALIEDQLDVYRRGVKAKPRPSCCDDPELTLRGFTEDQHNWMVEYPKAYVIPFDGGRQRSDAEANRMVRWLLDNGVTVSRATEKFAWKDRKFPAGSYVVWMDQALRGLALTALGPGQDVSNRILQLYAPPGAWSHGSLWGADVVEVPADGAKFRPATNRISSPNPLEGGIRGGTDAPADWYSVTLKGVSEHRRLLGLLRDGVNGQIAEESFTSTTGGKMPAGTFIFSGKSSTRTALNRFGKKAGVRLQRNVGVSKPSTTKLAEAPKVAILVNSANPGRTDTSESLRAIFGADAGFVSVSSGGNSIQNAETNPLLDFDVIYNTGQNWPSNATAQERLRTFFERGGGYIGTSQSTSNFAFLSGGGLIEGALTQGTQLADGGIARWVNASGAASPLTGGFPAEDNLYLPSSITYFATTPDGSTVAGRYHDDMTGTPPNGPSPGFVAGLWRNRQPSANSAPVIVHGTTTADSRYLGLATNPFSRQDGEREWALIAQAALWSSLTDDAGAAQQQAGPGMQAASRSNFVPFYPGVESTKDIPLLPGEKP